MVFDEILKGNVKDKLFIDCATVHPDTSYANKLRVVDAGARYIASMGFSPAVQFQFTNVLQALFLEQLR